MPRYVQHKPNRSQLNTRRNQYTIRGLNNRVDPFPLGFGTVPEKLVYEHLSRRNILFYYLNDIEISIPDLELLKTYQADFIIPSAKIIIEVQGAYWHSKPSAIESDAYKFAIYESGGWKVLAWWDYEILDDINKLFSASPELTALSHFDGSNKSGELTPMARTKTDTSQGIRTMNRRRAERLQYRKKPATLKTKKPKTYGGYFTYAK